MKQFILLFILLSIGVFTWSQGGVTATGSKTIISDNERWNLDKYVWSHTNYKTGKNDKPVLDFEALENWRSLGNNDDLSVSSNGEFFAYSVKNNHLKNKPDSIIVQSTKGDWRRAFDGAEPGSFSGDSKQYIFLSKKSLNFLTAGGDVARNVQASSFEVSSSREWLAYLLKNDNSSLVFQNLLTGVEKHFDDVLNFGFDKSGTWLACQFKNESKELFLYNLKTGKEFRILGVIDYKFGIDGKMLIRSIEKTDRSFQYVNLLNGERKMIWSSTDTTVSISYYGLDVSGSQAIFVTTDHEKNNSIWYYNVGMDKAVMKVNNQSAGIDTDFWIQGSASFTKNGRYIIFSIQQRPDNRKPDADAVSIDIWTYKDTLLQTTQATSLANGPLPYRMAIPTKGANVLRLENEFEFLKTVTFPGDYAVVGKISEQVNGDKFWKIENDYDSNWLVSLKDGSRTLLPTRSCNLQGENFWFSPGGNYLVFFDAERDYSYFSYDLHTCKLQNISLQVPYKELGYEDYFHHPKGKKLFLGETKYGIAAWLKDDKRMLVYDDYDIWELDLSGSKPPANLTNGYGRSHQVVLSLAVDDKTNSGSSVILSLTDTVLLKGFNRKNKEDGFYQKVLKQPGNPELLYMGPYFFQTQRLIQIIWVDDGMKPLKSKGSNTWIVKRQSAVDAPNYFVTTDFRTFKRLTDIQPQSTYNWLTSELHSFKQMDGSMSQGVLYKPTNFDPQKKYPVIISFYFHHSDQLNRYPSPELLIGPLDYYNPAWFVSHGYLVFCPDIYFKDKAWGPSTLNTMDGAARYLGGLTYVDSKRIGLTGHSNSGRMGYYVLTHSHYFAAMSIGTGALGPDYMSSALSFENGGNSLLRYAEKGGASGLGSLWDNKALWLDHTAVYQADKVIAPLLLFFNDKDFDPVSRGRELFMSLWRLEKKVWWLDYNKASHTLSGLNDRKDYTIRYTQFFDHYLKGAPAPRWMTNGIPHKLKGIECRYELNGIVR